MRSGSANWLARLRQRQRAVLCALVPAFALSAASGPACAAMLDSSAASAAEAYQAHDAHAVHHEHALHGADEQPAAPSTTACPHCPLESGAATAGHATCAALDGQEDGSAQPTSSSDRAPPQVVLPNWLLPAARAAPPLIVPLDRAATSFVASVPLNLRHCVLLI